jgi:hypothetical protein
MEQRNMEQRNIVDTVARWWENFLGRKELSSCEEGRFLIKINQVEVEMTNE